MKKLKIYRNKIFSSALAYLKKIIITQNIKYIHILITECFANIRNSFVGLLEKNNIDVNIHTLDQKKKVQKSSKNLNDINQTQQELKSIFAHNLLILK